MLLLLKNDGKILFFHRTNARIDPIHVCVLSISKELYESVVFKIYTPKISCSGAVEFWARKTTQGVFLKQKGVQLNDEMRFRNPSIACRLYCRRFNFERYEENTVL